MTDIVVHELVVAGSFLIAPLPVGSSLGYPSVLLRQLQSNDSTVQLDWETTTWIGSIHGVAALPGILMPAFMQWKGRKIAFIIACLVSIMGWIIAFTANTATAILISECFHGFGSQSILAVGMLSMSEMLSPRIRTATMGSYIVMQTLGFALIGIIGNYLHWKTIALIVSSPLIIVTVIVATIWPESPAWLAVKGEFDQCEKAFKRLRGTSEAARRELNELILAQKEIQSLDNIKQNKQNVLNNFWTTLKRRDFYLPAIHIFVLFQSMYWCGGYALFIYSANILQRATSMEDGVTFGTISMNVVLFFGCITSIILLRYINPKHILLGSGLCCVICVLTAAGVSYCQTVGYLTKETYILVYILVAYVYIIDVNAPIVIIMTGELMPVKHRGIGGPLYVTITCILHTSLLKTAPYLLKYFNLWGTFLVFGLNSIVTFLFIWKYVPDTKGKTLQQLEDYYAYGDMNKHREVEAQDTMDKLMTHKE